MKNRSLNAKLATACRRTAMTALLLMLVTLSGWAQRISGIVRDGSGNTLPGVSIIVKGTTNGTVTNADGAYTIQAPQDATLVFSYVGMKPQEKRVGHARTLNITLEDDESTLNDIVVVGYGKVKRESLTGAVSDIRGDKLLETPSTNISSLLGGRLPGLSSVQTSGQPGADQASLTIRGSLYGALYIVDGMPRAIDDIDPNDIESISVLKDGASAAVYGLNAAGGVVIVTTKHGAPGRVKVNYDGSYGVSLNANFPKFMNGPEFAYYYNMADLMDKLTGNTITSRDDYTPVFSRKNVEAMLNNDPTDGWDNVNYIDKVFGTGHNTKHNVSVSGGSSDVHYYISAGYMNQDGNVDNFTYRRYNMRANLDSKIGRDFRVTLGTTGTVTRTRTPAYSSGGADDGSEGSGEVGWLSIGHQTIMMHPYLPEKYNDLYTATLPNNAAVAYSPLAAIYDSGYKRTRGFTSQTNLTVEYAAPWLKGLTFKATGAYDYYSANNKNLDTPYKTYRMDLSQPNTYYQLQDPRSYTTNHVASGNTTTERLVGQLSVEYARDFGLHHVNALLLAEERDYKASDLAAYVENVPFSKLPEINYGQALKNSSPVSGGSYHTRTAGYVFRLGYNYADTYLAEVSGRYDGSYKFNGNKSDKRWGLFPSVSAAWRISKMSFMQSTQSWLDDLKLRASIGLLGNDGSVPAYSYLSTYSFGGDRIINGQLVHSLYSSNVPNPTLTWSKTRTTDVGFDATLFGGKLELSFDYFYNYNYDLLAAMGSDKAPSMGGYYTTYRNYERYESHGLEWTITHRNTVQLASKPFAYSASLNMTYAKNKWLRYPDSPNSQEWRKVVGTSVDAYDAWIADGLFRTEEEIDGAAWYGTRPNLGDIKYRDLNGDGKIDEQDKARIGRSNRPRIMMGLNLAASWNGFDLAAQFTGGFQFDVSLLGTYYNGYDDNTVWTQTFKEGANSPLWLIQNSYTIDNTTAEYPRMTLGNMSHGGDNGLASTFWMKKGDYVRLKSLQVGYTFPARWLRPAGIEKLRVYVEGSNLFTIDDLPTGIDPESPRVNNGYYPQQRTLMGGINLTF